MVKNPPGNAEDLGSVDHWSGKSPHAAEQLSQGATTTKACTPRAHALQQEKPLQQEASTPQWGVAPTPCTRESPCAAAKTQHSQKQK